MRPDYKAQIARRFKALRRRSFLTQRRLAGLIGICRQAVSEIENRRTLPHSGTWERFAALETKHKLAPDQVARPLAITFFSSPTQKGDMILLLSNFSDFFFQLQEARMASVLPRTPYPWTSLPRPKAAGSWIGP